MAELSVSAFAADFLHMERDIRYLESSGADSMHIDVMDGHFVPLFGFNYVQAQSLEKICGIKKSVHIMAYQPCRIIRRFLLESVDKIIIHVECGDPNTVMKLLRFIRSSGKGCGLALSPQTSISHIVPYLPLVDEILVMSSAPGIENSSFLDSAYERIEQVSGLISGAGSGAVISVDGGLNLERACRCIEAGAQAVVLGRTFYREIDKKGIADKIHQKNGHLSSLHCTSTLV